MDDIQTNNENSRIPQLTTTIIDHVIMKASDGDFKNLYKDLPNCSLEERRMIAEETLNKSHLKFLNLFGKYLLEDHLEYFKGKNVDNYEINFHLHRLSRLINSKKVICKNRRYQAMLELLKGDYFSDNEMRNREPLLWEQLIGQYLTEEEKFHHDNQFVVQNSLTEVLFEQIDRDNRDDLKRQQQIDEVQEPIEDDNDDDDDNVDDMSNEPSNSLVVNNTSNLWGEYSKPKNKTLEIGKRRWKNDHFVNLEQCNTKILSENERLLLLEEFKSHMIHKFLNGQEDFDYNNVDNNPEYDNLHIKGMDEEEKYFDSESPVEEISPVENETEEILSEQNDTDDELETYMSMLKKNEIADSVADKLKKL